MTHRPGLPDYDEPARFPERVWRAIENSREDGFELACLPEVGRLLQLFAGMNRVERICELGTAYGVGSAWIESGMRSRSTLVTIELDARRAVSARTLFEGVSAVEVLTGDWSLAATFEPFDVLFSDGGPKRNPGDPERLLPLLKLGGLVILDDYTPGVVNDVARRIWFDSPAYRTIEVTLTPSSAVLLATRR